jgi:N-acetylneuraminic acid mutarotase
MTARRVLGVMIGVLVVGGMVVQVAPASAVAQGWSTAASMATARQGHTATLLPDGRVLVVGGWDGSSGTSALATGEIYDPAADTWSSVASMADARQFHTATLLQNGDVLVAGGWDSSGTPLASAELYDSATDSWSPAASMGIARQGHTATSLRNGKVLVVGGSDGGFDPLASAELYDPGTDTWSSAGSMTVGRIGHAATLLGGPLASKKVLVAGGFTGSTYAIVRSAELYDPDTNTWSTTGSMANDRDYFGLAMLPDGKVLAAGGGNNNSPPGNHDDSAELYDPGSGTWAAAGTMSTVRVGQTSTLLGNGTVLVAGGTDGPSALAGAEVYNPFALPFADPWSAAGTMAVARTSHTATLLPDGEVLVVGGRGGAGFAVLASAERYDPATGDWTSAASMSQARADHTATLLQDGRVLVAGGLVRPYALDSAELYDPATDTWSAASSLATARFDHTATLLNDGRVLVTGGQDGSFGVLASAELYDPVSDSWAPAPDMASPRAGHTATLLGDGKVLVIGGFDDTDAVTSAELFDPATDSWSAAASMAEARGYHTATLLLDGKVLVAGGSSQLYYDGMVWTEIYDPATDSWSSGAHMARSRLLQTATLLQSGKVLVMGGDSFGYGQATAELYDPAANAWTQVSKNSFYPRSGHTATLLGNGNVLVIGGEGTDYGGQGRVIPFALSFAPTESDAGSMAWARMNHTATLLPSGEILVTGGLYANAALATAELYGGTGDGTAPTVTLTSPPEGATYSWGQPVTASYACQDESGGSGLASCTGSAASGGGIDTIIPGSHAFTVQAKDVAGNATSVSHHYTVLKGTLNGDVTVSAGATVTTDPGGVGASPGVPIQTSVQVPVGGIVSVDLGSTTQAPPLSYLFLGSQVTITAPDATSTSGPLTLTFSLDASLGPDPSVIRVAKNGVLIADCNATHSNLPCAAIPAATDAHGDLSITAYTMQASTWNFAVHEPYTFSGFFQPVDNVPVLNSAKGGSAIPVKFALGGDQGLGVLARAHPVSQRVSCDADAALDAIEQTLTAGSSSLSYSGGQYTYVWKTEKSWAGTCRDLIVKLIDGSVHTAHFKFK